MCCKRWTWCCLGGAIGAAGVYATEAVVGAGAVEQSNSGNGLDDMPLASAAMVLLSLYYALKW